MSSFEYELDEETKRELAIEAFRSEMREQAKKGRAETILDNIGYATVFALVEEGFALGGKKVERIIADKVVKVIGEMSSYSLFREADRYNNRSVGQELLNDSVTAHRHLIDERVGEIIAGLGFDSIRDLVVESVRSMFDNNEREDAKDV